MAKKLKEKLEKARHETPELSESNGEIIESPAEGFWRVGSFAVIFIAAALRFYWLAFKPFHHDEGVNGWFLTNLFRSGVYHYDPENYHGPTLYFFSLVSTYLFGLNDFAVRFVPAMFGVLIVVAVLSLRRYIGTIGALAAAMLIAVSPGMMFISRYFIHEMLFAFFTLGVAVGGLKFMERGRVGETAISLMTLLLLICLLPGTLSFAASFTADKSDARFATGMIFFAAEVGIVYLLMRSLVAWENGKPIYLFLAAASAALTFASKETAFISFGTMLIALFCVFVWRKIWRGEKENIEQPTWSEAVDLNFKTFLAALGEPANAVWIIALTFTVFAFVWVLFFTSFFTYPEGFADSFKAYDIWTKTGTKDHADNGLLAYVKWGAKIESPLLVLSAIGSIIAFWKAKHKFAMFAALWAFGLFAAYTLIPYKTPWLAINYLMPMAIIAGYGINEIAAGSDKWQRAAAAFLAAAAFGISTYQAVELNFYRYDDDTEPYVYAHTRRSYNDLIGKIEEIARRATTEKQASIIVVSPDYWAMPWTLRNYPKAGFYGKFPDEPISTAEMIIAKTDQETEVEEKYGAYYTKVGTYDLRPGVELMLYARKDLAVEP